MVDTEARIEARLEARFGRPALHCPSGRLALFLALTERFAVGDRLLMSPVDDDVVALVVLAAGLRPVMGPLDQGDGNLAVDTVAPSTWDSLAGVLTTNLYGVPERAGALRERCDAHDLVLIEDVAHALVVDEAGGRPVGHRGDAVVVSLSKHGRGRGGGALITSGEDGDALRQRRDRLLVRAGPMSRARTIAARAVRAAGVEHRAIRVRRALVGSPRGEHRMQVRPDDLRLALAGAPDLPAADAWVGIDDRRYRERPTGSDRRRALEAVDRADREVAPRGAGVDRLRRLPAAAAGIRGGPPAPLFRVPLLLADRDRAARVMVDAGIPLQYVYDPPLDDLLGPEFVDPLEANRFLEAGSTRPRRRWPCPASPFTTTRPTSSPPSWRAGSTCSDASRTVVGGRRPGPSPPEVAAPGGDARMPTMVGGRGVVR